MSVQIQKVKDMKGTITGFYSFQDEKTKKKVNILQITPMYGKARNISLSDEELQEYGLDGLTQQDLFGREVKLIDTTTIAL